MQRYSFLLEQILMKLFTTVSNSTNVLSCWGGVSQSSSCSTSITCKSMWLLDPYKLGWWTQRIVPKSCWIQNRIV